MNVIKSTIDERLFSVKESEVIVYTIPQAEAIGEVVSSLYKREYTYNHLAFYYTELAACMAEIGCYRMGLKCRVKSLLFTYQEAYDGGAVPMDEFQSLYYELLELGYERAAARLMACHQRVVNYLAYLEQRALYANTPLDKWFNSILLLANEGFESIKLIDSDEDMRKSFELLPYNDNRGKWGYSDGLGAHVIEAIYDDVREFDVYSDFFAAVNVAGKWGVINREGYEVVAPKYDAMTAASDATHFDIELRGVKGKLDLFGNEYWAVSPRLVAPKYDDKSKVTPCLMGYLSDYILPKYRRCYIPMCRCSAEDIADEALRSLVECSDYLQEVPFVKKYYASKDMLYTAAVFHNLSITEGRDRCYARSAQLLCDDYYIRAFFSQEEVQTMCEAIADISLPADSSARSFYGEVLRAVVGS